MKIKLLNFLATIALTGCVTPSTIISVVPNREIIDTGIRYSIPKQDVQFSFKRISVTEKKLKKTIEESEEALEEKSTNLKTKSAEVKMAGRKLKIAGKETKAKLVFELELVKIEEALLEIDKKKADLAHKKAKEALVKHKRNPVSYKDSFSLEGLPLVPDNAKVFLARSNNGIFSSGTTDIKINDDGFLGGGSGQTVGQFDEIFVALAGAIGSIQKRVPEVASALIENESSEILTTPIKEISFSYKIDLSLGVDIWQENLNKKLIKRNINYKVDLVTGLSSVIDDSKDGKKKKSYNGLIYPGKTSIRLDIIDLSDRTPNQSLYLSVVDNNALSLITFPRGVFATNDFEYEFKNGLLTKYKLVTQNELVEFFNMIPRAAKALISIPGELIKLKVDYSTQEEAYYKAQEAAIAARLSLKSSIDNDVDTTSDDVENGDGE